MDHICNDDNLFTLYFITSGVNAIRSKVIVQRQQLVYGLAGLRIILCMMPQNNWLSASAQLSWGIYRNIPFALMGILIIVLFYKSAKREQ